MSYSNIDETMTQLEDLHKLIKKAVINHKKCPKERITLGYLKVRMENIDDYWESFKKAHNTLLKLTKREERAKLDYFQQDSYSSCEETYLVLKTEMQDTINYSTGADITKGTTIKSNVEVKLPKIDLPKYSGNYEEWQSFRDAFTTLIHNNQMLNDMQRLHYLKSCLLGEAKSILKQYQVTESNYLPAWNALKQRYNHRRLIVNSILKRMFSKGKVQGQSANQLKIFIDTIRECLTSLKQMNISTDSWDPVIIFHAVQKLDIDAHKEWEDQVTRDCDTNLPTLDHFIKFIENKIHTFALTSPSVKPTREHERTFHTSTLERVCICCREDHALYHCKKFSKLKPDERYEFTKSQKLCYNCLIPGHPAYRCRQKISCKMCGRHHHSLLHQYKRKETSENEEGNKPTEVSLYTNVRDEEVIQNKEDELAISSHFAAKKSTALLATAVVPVKDKTGRVILLRALIDHGSQATFISERAVQLLNVKRTQINGTITGVGSTKTRVSHAVHIEVLSRCDKDFNLNVKAYIISTRLTTQLPVKEIQQYNWPHLKGLFLADPGFNQPGRIDLLLGVEAYARILKNEIIKGPLGTPCAQNTYLGWILFGKVDNEQSNKEDVISMHLSLDLDVMLKNMWELEPSDKRIQTADEKLCENIYEATHTRQADGRYVVKLPMKTNQTIVVHGETKEIALRRLHQLERRFERNPELKKEYCKVIEEYIELKHMEEVPENEINNLAVYLPHHPVVREDKETTKTRVVFDASAKGTNNVSLNDELLVGPHLQEDMRNLIMRWRMKRICFVADIQKMYRQILVTKQDADLQRILWRKSTTEKVKEYRLLRVTFGTASAPYLAVKTLQQVSVDEGQNCPRASQAIKEDFYIDDLMSGEDNVQDAIKLANDITNILQKGGFTLQKWSSNSAEFLQHFQPSQRTSHAHVDIRVDGAIRALGLFWDMGKDIFQYHLTLPPIPKVITKRNILAEIQRLFDPLGWLAPAIVPAKILVQKLWMQGIGWDDEIDFDDRNEWLTLRQGFKNLCDVKLNRWLHTSEDLERVSVHGFCDASIKAYAAVANIIAAKTRVAPVKHVSLPRLELCGAVVLSRLLKQIREATRLPISQIHAWTDSQVVLSWLHGDLARWNVFVSNRVVEILDNVGNQTWNHVSSRENPADIASRGVKLLQLKENHLWWTGPSWLSTEHIPFNKQQPETTNLEKRKTIIVSNLKVTEEERNKSKINFDIFDNLKEIQKAIVYAIRFLNSKRKPENTASTITTEELEDALERSIKLVQEQEFSNEIVKLREGRDVDKRSSISSLNPFLDKKNILRVGGRLRHASVPENMKHPIILGYNNALVPFIVADAHQRTLHGGIQLMMSFIRSRYWIVRAKNIVKSVIHRCIICARQRAVTREQLMGDLPKARVTPARPFLHSGVDFAGPLQILISRGRGAKCSKAYIAIFICMATKAIHLELVGDLSSDSFLGAFKRFVARRGKCSHIWSDQGTNFIAADKELRNLWYEATVNIPETLINLLAEDGTQWHFNPPYSPNFGGLWEAGVKSIKYHLRRILNMHLTFEEMSTTLCQIEACVNSRPLCPVDSADIDNLNILTPGHFLIGEAPINVPEPDLNGINTSRLSRWQHMQKLTQEFWHRWQSEYLSRLQERPKWQRRQNEFQIGDIVLLREDNLPPGKWALGRITARHPGQDNICRVYSLKCNGKIVKRSRSKLCELPICND